jgi:hypothetical protein
VSAAIEEQEEVCRAVLTAPIETTSAALAEQVGRSREFVRQVRLGLRCRQVLPDLERITPDAMARTCVDCALFHHQPGRMQSNGNPGARVCGVCTIGIPEAENIHYARGCGAFQAAGKA